MPGITYCEK